MSYTEESTHTYTVADIGKVFDCFAADFDMVSQATGLRTRDDVINTCADVKDMAKNGYLSVVNLYLRDAQSQIIRATKYEVMADGYLQTSQRPGNNMWPQTPNGHLCVLVEYSKLWWQLSDSEKKKFEGGLRKTWGVSNLDTSFPMLSRTHDRDYVSNGYGIRKTIFQ